MAKKEPPKPLFPLKHEFYVSLDAFTHEAGMLADMVRQCIHLGAVDQKAIAPLQERLNAFAAIRFGDKEG